VFTGPSSEGRLVRLTCQNCGVYSLRDQNAALVFPLCILLVACFGVFVLPFLLPAPYLADVSAANAAGFNNKVVSLAAAALGAFVFFAALTWPRLKQERSNSAFSKLPRLLVLTTVFLCGCIVALLSYVLAISRLQYGDGGYFMRQISMHFDYHRKLYDQIEFTYGALLFYAPGISLRVRGQGDQGAMLLEVFLARARGLVESKSINL
jgi:hypothetical protein